MKAYATKKVSILLVVLMLSTLFSGITVGATGKSVQYYVAPNGTGDGRSVDTPTSAITIALQSIIEDGHTADDDVTIYVSGGEGATAVPSGGLALNYDYPWPNSGGSDATTPANITITSMPGSTAPAVLSSSSDAPLVIMANTVFKNIILLDQSGEERIFTNGYNVTFDEDVTFRKGESLSAYAPKIHIGSGYDWGVRNDNAGTLTVNNTSNNKNFTLNFGGYTWNGEGENEANYLNGDKTVIVNGGTVDNLYLVGFKRNAEYNSDISVVLNGAKLNAAAVSSESGYAPVIDGSIQIVANGTTLPDMSDMISYSSTSGTPCYIMTSDNNGSLMTTQMAGRFTVQSDFEYAYAYNATTVYYGNEILQIDNAGTYTVGYADSLADISESLTGEWVDNGDGTMSKVAATAVYYVQYGGTGDGLSPDNPLATVDDAVKAANSAGYIGGDTVYINVLQSDGWNWGVGSIGAGENYRADAHRMTTWAARGTVTSHKFTIVVQGEEDGDIYLASSGQLGHNLDMVLGGPTVFKDIVLVRMRRWRGLYANGYDVTYGKGTRFACVNVDDCASTFTAWDGKIYTSDENVALSLGDVNKLSGGGGGTIEFDNETPVFTITVSSFADIWSGSTPTGPEIAVETYTNDVTLAYNNSNIVSNIRWGNQYGGGTLFEKNLNLNIKSLASIQYLQGKGSVTVNGGLQIISSMELDEFTAIPDNVTVNGGKWFIKNDGICDLIGFTDIAGTFAVKQGCGAVAINNISGEKIFSSGALLTVPAGEYTVIESDTDNGVTDTNDLITLRKFLLGANESIGSFADYNRDGNINIIDLVVLKKHLSGIKLAVGGYLMTAETLSGGADAEAAALQTAIMTKADTTSSSGKTYYVSSSGNDNRTGLFENYPIKTISKVNQLDLKSGDRVLFKRGDTFRTGEQLNLVSGVSYGAYGTGDKPKIYGSLKDYASADLWQSDNNALWKTSLSANEAGNMVFNGGKAVGVLKNTLAQVKSNGDYYFDKASSTLYLYLRENNPGQYFSSIEISSTENLLYAGNKTENVTVENLTLKYAAEFGISMFIVKGGFNITGCEIGWIGGGYTNNETETETRYGNAIEFWCHAENCNVTDNYIYQVYDAAITFQGSADNTYKNLNISNNLIEYCSMNFEFWAKEPVKNGVIDRAEIADIHFTNNILRFSGYGFGGKQRPNRSGQAFVLAWNYEYNDGQISNFNITENIFDCANSYFFYGKNVFDNINLTANTYYQLPGSEYFVIRNKYSKAENQEELERAISSVDNSATSIKFIKK